MKKPSITFILAVIFYSASTFAQNANTQLSNLNSNTNINSHLRPNSTGILDLGTSARQWRDLNVSRNINIGVNRFISNAGAGNTWIGDGTGILNTIGVFNTATGSNALTNNTTGSSNSAFGGAALQSNSTGEMNSAFGTGSLMQNTIGIRNSAFGNVALTLNTVGNDNCAFGESSLMSNISGNFNSAFGVGSLSFNISGEKNVAMGFGSMLNNTSGHDNVAIGSFAYQNNQTGFFNIAIGSESYLNNTTGHSSIAIGWRSLYNNTTGAHNIAVGTYSLSNNTTGYHNTAIGVNSQLGGTGFFNSSVGAYSLFFNTTGLNNAAFGVYALHKNSGGNDNSAFGNESLKSNSLGFSNTAFGRSSLLNNTSGNENVSIGMNSLINNSTGNGNTAVGHFTMQSNISGSYNTAIGYGANVYNLISQGPVNATAIGNGAFAPIANSAVIGNTAVTYIGGYSSWTTFPSDSRFKKDVKQNVPGLEFIRELKPVTYHVKVSEINKKLNIPDSLTDKESIAAKEKILYTGFIAQDVEAAAKKINYDFSGIDIPQNKISLYGLRYAEFVVPIVKALQELDIRNNELQLQNMELKRELELIRVGLNLEEKKLSTASFLYQNFPNPFNTETIIKYVVGSNTVKVFLKINNLKGEEVFYSVIEKPGSGEVKIDAGVLSPGMYVFSLVVDTKIADSKVMIVEE